MEKLRFKGPEGLVVDIRSAHSDAAVQWWEQDQIEVALDGKPDQCSVEQVDHTFAIDSRVAVSISVPRGAPVNIGETSGDLLVRDVAGDLSIDTVYGDLSIKDGASDVSIGQVHGDIAVGNLSGSLTIQQSHADVQLSSVANCTAGSVHGSVRIRGAGQVRLGSVSGDVRVADATGDLVVESVMGDLRVRDLGGAMDIKHVQGDISIRTALLAGCTYVARAGGSISAKFPEGSTARFELTADGEIKAKLPQIDLEEENRVLGQAGDGQATVILHADGDLSVKVREQAGGDDEPDLPERLSSRIEAQIAQHLGQLDTLDAKVRQKVEQAMRRAEHELDRELSRTQRHVEQRTVRAEERVRRAAERAARAAQKAQAKMASKRNAWGVSFASVKSPSGAGPAPDAISEEERLAVLKMLQENKITVQEAQVLLSALEAG